jgi:hypothetical protein
LVLPLPVGLTAVARSEEPIYICMEFLIQVVFLKYYYITVLVAVVFSASSFAKSLDISSVQQSNNCKTISRSRSFSTCHSHGVLFRNSINLVYISRKSTDIYPDADYRRYLWENVFSVAKAYP